MSITNWEMEFKDWGQKDLFDAIIISATSEVIPEKLLENLKLNGRLNYAKKIPFRKSKIIID